MHPYANSNAKNRAQQAAQALASSLANPYQPSSHYAQAYYGQQASSSAQMVTPEGYSYSSTYVPSFQPQPQQPLAGSHQPRGVHGFQNSRGGGNRFNNQRGQQQQTHWYEPGDCRCTYQQCTFTGSKKSVETHMMDRHLIYPPGWDMRKRKNDWDADPSLKNGKPIPIQGTNLLLDTPEAVEAWIAERRKRWPTASRVEEKEKKLKDALDRGEIAASDSALRGRKRPRQDDRPGSVRSQIRRGGGIRGTGRGGAHASRTTMVHPLPMKPVTTVPMKIVESDDEKSSSGSDVDPEKDAISSKPPPKVAESDPEEEILPEKKEVERTSKGAPQSIKPQPRKSAIRPKAPPSQRNPFANRPSLLRNLLLPEIRMTVSNLSQAIHFLVENDFLQDVELNPGDADYKPIEVIGETNHETA